jgi:hypothetical protein
VRNTHEREVKQMSKIIMTDLEKFNELIDSSDFPINVIARRAGMTPQSLHNKRRGERELTVSEIISFCEIFNLTKKQRDEIFLTPRVRNTHI